MQRTYFVERLLNLGFDFIIYFIAISVVFSWKERKILADEVIGAATSIPTVTYTNGQQQLLAPDWSKITWSNLPPIESPGWIRVTPQSVSKLGYDPNRIWHKGSRPDDVVMLGDVQEAFHLEAFNLKDISGLTNLDMRNVRLVDFGLTQWQTPKSLVKAIPTLGKLPVAQIAPLRDLFKITDGWGSPTVAQAIQQNAAFANIPLGELDLRRYNLASIPGLDQTAINKFTAWQQSFIAQIPGLSSVPFGQFPLPITGSGISVAVTDLVWSAVEHGDPKVPSNLFISGSVNKKGITVPVPCVAGKPCAYIELSDLMGAGGSNHGKRWVSGKVQKVKGGFGPLAAVNNGWEPAGKLVFGSAFKVVLTDTNESRGTANFALYMRACVHISFSGKSCTPYFIGGIPWIPTNERGLVIVASTAKPNVNIDSKYTTRIAQIEAENQPTPAPSNSRTDSTELDNATNAEGGNVSLSEKGNIPARIAQAAKESDGMVTNKAPGTQGGKLACAWAVNSVLNRAGIKTLGGNCSLAVACVEADLQSGRGQLISDRSKALAGDIALIPGAHIGICENDGCTRILSNSSSKGAFVWHSDKYMSPSYGRLTKVYRVKN